MIVDESFCVITSRSVPCLKPDDDMQFFGKRIFMLPKIFL